MSHRVAESQAANRIYYLQPDDNDFILMRRKVAEKQVVFLTRSRDAVPQCQVMV